MGTPQALQLPAASFDFLDLLNGSRQSLAEVNEELRNATQFWQVAEQMLQQIDQYRELNWQDVDGLQIEVAIKGMQKLLQKDVKVRWNPRQSGNVAQFVELLGGLAESVQAKALPS